MTVAEPFYDQLMPLLGFDLKQKGGTRIADRDFHVVEYCHPRLAFAINSPRSAFARDAVHRRRPGALHHLAFKAASRAVVDELHILVEVRTKLVNNDRGWRTPDGIKYEIVHAP